MHAIHPGSRFEERGWNGMDEAATADSGYPRTPVAKRFVVRFDRSRFAITQLSMPERMPSGGFARTDMEC